MLYVATNYDTPQDALDDAETDPYAVVEFPPKLYELEEKLVVHDSTEIWSYGAYFKGINGNHGLLRSFRSTDSFSSYNGPSHISVYGGTWDCDGQNAPPNTVTNGLNFCHGSNIKVIDVTVKNVAGAHGLELSAIRGATVQNCKFLGFIDNTTAQNRQFSEAIQVDITKSSASAEIGDFDNTPCKNITINNCHTSNSNELGYFGALVGGHVTVENIWHEKIRVINCDVSGSLSYGIRPFGWQDSVITGNTIEDTGGTSILTQHSRNLSIIGNIVRNSGSNGINVSGSYGINVQANNVVGTIANYGIWVGTSDGIGSNDVVVQNNYVKNANLAALRLSSGADNCLVAGNRLVRGTTGGSTGIICASGVGTTNRIVDNSLLDFITALSNTSGTVISSY